MRLHPGAFLIRCALALAVVMATLTLLSLGLRFPGAVTVLLGVAAYRRAMAWRGSGDAYGTARPSSLGDLWGNSLLDGDGGLIMGTCGYVEPPTKAEGLAALFSLKPSALACRLFLAAFLGRGWCSGITIRVKDAVHVGVYASTGAGKGVSVLIPILLSDKRSVVVLDPQGSLYAAAATHRQQKFGHRIVRLDSSGICGEGGDAVNPIDFLDPKSPGLFDGCKELASLLVVRKGTETDPHWDDRAEQVLTCFIYLIAAHETDPARRNLLSVRDIVSSRDAYMAIMNVMRTMPDPVVKELGDSLTWLASDELNSVLSVVQRHIAWMTSPVVADSLRRSSFDPMDLKRGRLSVFIIEHPQRLETMAAHLRVMLGTILRVITRGAACEANPVLFMIDETAAIGRMHILENAITQLRGYGIRLLLVFQSIGQLQKVYGENAQTIADNLGTQLYFCTRAYDSLEHLSKLIGDCTIQTSSLNNTKGHSHPTGVGREPQPGNASTSTSLTTNEAGRRWAKAEEIRTLPKDFGLLFHSNLNVITPQLLRHYDSPLFRHGRAGESLGLGLAGAGAAVAALFAACFLSAAVASLPAPAMRQSAPPSRAVGQARRLGRSGRLIRIPDPLPPPDGPAKRAPLADERRF